MERFNGSLSSDTSPPYFRFDHAYSYRRNYQDNYTRLESASKYLIWSIHIAPKFDDLVQPIILLPYKQMEKYFFTRRNYEIPFDMKIAPNNGRQKLLEEAV